MGYRANVDPEAVDAIDFADRIRLARAATAAASGQEVGPEALETNLAAYDAALELWRGEPLSDFNTEQWAINEAARLNALRITALTERAQTALALGRHHEVVHDLEPVVGGDPTLESLAGLLMVALYRGGRQADALEVYARTRQTLDEELGLEPSVTLRSLQERVLRQDESLGAQAEMAVPVRAPASGQRRTMESAPAGTTMQRGGWPHGARTNLPTVVRPLIGRDELLESLTDPPARRQVAVPRRAGWLRQDVPRAHSRRSCAGGLPGRCLRGATRVAGHGASGSRRGRGRARHADGRCRRRR